MRTTTSTTLLPLLTASLAQGMLNWSPTTLHLPSSASSLSDTLHHIFHPTSQSQSQSSPDAPKLEPTLKSPSANPSALSSEGHATPLLPSTSTLPTSSSEDDDANTVILLVTPALSPLLHHSSPASSTEAKDEAKDEEEAQDFSILPVSDTDTEIEDFISPFLPPLPTAAAKADAPVSSVTAIPIALSSSNNDDDKDGEDSGPAFHEGHFALGSTEIDDAPAFKEGAFVVVPVHEHDHVSETEAGHSNHHMTLKGKVPDCVKHAMHSMRAHGRYLVPDTPFQLLVFVASFTITLAVVLRAAVLRARRQRRELLCSFENGDVEHQGGMLGGGGGSMMRWEVMKVAGVEVGAVQRGVVRRGECVWVEVRGDVGAEGKEREEGGRWEKVWLEGEVGVRGKEVWDHRVL